MNQTLPIDLVHLITQLAVYTEILPVIFYFIFFKKNYNVKGLRVILFVIVIGFLVDIYGFYLNSVGQSNFLFYNLFVLLETISLLVFYHSILKGKFIRVFIYIASAIFIILWSYMFATRGDTKFLDSAVTIEYVLILIASIYFYFQIIKKPETPIFTSPHFWIISAYMLYIAGTFFLFLFLDTLPPKEQEKYYIVNFVFLLVKTILLSIAMFMKPPAQERKKFQLT